MAAKDTYTQKLQAMETLALQLAADVSNAKVLAASTNWETDADTTTIDTHMANLKSGLATCRTAVDGLNNYGAVGDQT